MFENKKKFALWMYPDTLQKVGEIYRGDNCESKSEFIEKAVNFYIGYLTSEDNKSFLPSIVTSTLKSIVAESDNRTSRILFKIAVELAILQNIVAATKVMSPAVIRNTVSTGTAVMIGCLFSKHP